MRAVRLVCVALAGLAAGFTSAASAQQSGVMRTAESQGREPGCVSWEQFSEPRPTRDAPQRVIVWFRFNNGCGRPVWIRWASLTDAAAQNSYGALGSTIPLETGASYGTATTASNYFWFNQPRDLGARFWLIEYASRPVSGSSPEMRGCGPGSNATRYAPCPPSFRLQL